MINRFDPMARQLKKKEDEKKIKNTNQYVFRTFLKNVVSQLYFDKKSVNLNKFQTFLFEAGTKNEIMLNIDENNIRLLFNFTFRGCKINVNNNKKDINISGTPKGTTIEFRKINSKCIKELVDNIETSIEEKKPSPENDSLELS